MKLYRIAIGIIAILFLGLGAFLYLGPAQVNEIIPGMLVRIGALLAVIWLAYPQLEKSKDHIPGFILGIGLACLVLIAARPKIGHIIIALGMITIGVSMALKFVSGITDNKPRR